MTATWADVERAVVRPAGPPAGVRKGPHAVDRWPDLCAGGAGLPRGVRHPRTGAAAPVVGDWCAVAAPQGIVVDDQLAGRRSQASIEYPKGGCHVESISSRRSLLIGFVPK